MSGSYCAGARLPNSNLVQECNRFGGYNAEITVYGELISNKLSKLVLSDLCEISKMGYLLESGNNQYVLFAKDHRDTNRVADSKSVRGHA